MNKNNHTDFYDDDDDVMGINDSIDFTDDDAGHNDGTDNKNQKINETPEERENREIEQDTIIRGYNRMRIILYSIAAAVVIGVLGWLWLRYFSPYTTEATETGCVMEMKCQGLIFKTYEGDLLSKKYIQRPDDWLEYHFPFSVANDSLARQIMQIKGTGKMVTLHYEEYKGIVFWRGNSHRIITAIEFRDEK